MKEGFFMSNLRQKIAAVLTAGCLGFTGLTASYAFLPAPQVQAKSVLTNIIAAGIQGAQMRAEMNKQLNYYNNTDSGRYELLNSFKQKYGVNEEAYYNDKIAAIMTNMSSAVAQVDPSINDKPYLYFVNEQTSFNAFCSLGHVMSINRGLFNTLQNDDEIAAVIGHEMVHGQKDHVIKDNKAALDKYIMAQMAVIAAGGTTISAMIGNFLLNQSNVQTTKGHEWEADNIAFEYLTHSNYNPGAAGAVWQRRLDTVKGAGDDKGTFWNPSDHPGDTERRDNYAKKLYEYSGKHASFKDGSVYVNDKKFVTPAATEDMTSAERAFFVLGNIAAAYNHGQDKDKAYVKGDVVMLGAQPIMQVLEGDESAAALSQRLNELK